jgi:hypothetical protein
MVDPFRLEFEMSIGRVSVPASHSRRQVLPDGPGGSWGPSRRRRLLHRTKRIIGMGKTPVKRFLLRRTNIFGADRPAFPNIQ